ncbi:single-stranded DNA-binding protein [Candidatus Gottesmanbacteria bacterium]|nr:single-stranded DNA-binding protein [Candidatus Gottesmanbacteria bacterium]
MSARSLNKVILIGNLTRDPELRYTPAGTAVCTFGLATNRSWTTQTGETKEETEFHRIVAWNKLGELCAQLLAKGRKTYVEGRLSTHSWTGQDGTQRMTTEVVIEDMIILDSKRLLREGESAGTVAEPTVKVAAEPVKVPEVDVKADVVPQGENTSQDKPKEKKAVAQAPSGKKPTDKKKEEKEEEKPMTEDITPDDIPF